MKRLLTIILLLFTFVTFGQLNQIDVKKAYVRNWLIYQGDTLAIVAVLPGAGVDSLVVTRGNTVDTLIMGGANHWDLTGNNIENNNSGKVTIDSLHLYPLPPEADRVGRIPVLQTNGLVEWASPLVVYDTMQRDAASAPSTLTTWIRGTNNLYPATTTDTVKVLANLKLPLTTSTNGIVFVDKDRFLHSAGTNNIFMGIGAGKLTTTSTWNVGIGQSVMTDITTAPGNVGIGYYALNALKTGTSNVAIGYNAMRYDTLGGTNVAIGSNAMRTTVGSSCNVAIGANALYTMTTGFDNVGIGSGNSQYTTTGAKNTSVGCEGLKSNTTGLENTAIGDSASYGNTTGRFITSLGYRALKTSIDVDGLTAIGHEALSANTSGTQNVALGEKAARNNTTGDNITALGYRALITNTTGDYNTAVGTFSLYSNNSSYNTALGYYSMYNTGADGTRNVAVGTGALQLNVSGDGNVAIGDDGGRGIQSGYNTVIGYNTMYVTASGGGNCAVGANALDANTSGAYNVGMGYESLTAVTSGQYNTAVGTNAGHDNTTGHRQVWLGANAGNNAAFATADDVGGVDNSNTATPLLYFNFATNAIKVNGSFSSAQGTVINNDSTPDVSGANTFIYNGTANSVTIDDLDNPTVGEYYTFIGNSDTYTLNFPGTTNFKMTGVGYNLGQYDIIQFYCYADNIYIMTFYQNITP